MTVDVFSAILAYATVPVYVFGLLFLIYIIARTQLGFTFTGQVKEVVKSKVAERRRLKTKTPIISYVVVAAMFVLFIGATIVTERKQHL